MRLAARLLGLFFLLAVVVVLVLAGGLVPAGDGGDPKFMSLGALWYSLDPGSLNLIQAVIERYVWAPLWDPVLLAVLQWPAVPTFAVLGVLLMGVSFIRRRGREDAGGDGSASEPDVGPTGPSAR